MNKGTFRIILLSIASILSIGTLAAFFFVGANVINDIQISQFVPISILVLLLLLLSVGSVIYAWFNRKIGGLLITLSSILIIIFNLFDLNEVSFYWQQGGLLLVGLLLFFSQNNSKFE